MFEGPKKIEYPKEESCISEESFNSQLDEPKKVETEFGTLEYVAIEPEVYSEKPPVLFIGGFGQGKDTYVDEMYDLCQSGRKVIYANPRKGFEVQEGDELNTLKDKFDVSDTVLAKVQELDVLLAEEKDDKVDLIGHSQGGLVLSVLSAYKPELAQNLVLQSPQGFQGDKSTGELATKLAKQLVLQVKDNQKEKQSGNSRPSESAARAGLSFVKEFSHNMIWRLFNEVPGSAKVEILPILEHIKQTREETQVGPNVVLLTAQSDALFDHETYETAFGLQTDEDGNYLAGSGEEVFNYVDNWAMYTREGAGHNAAVTELPGLLRQALNQYE